MQAHRTGFAIFTTLAIMGYVGQAGAAEEERFEISSIKAIRPTLVDTITALQQRDVARAKAAFEMYDSGWNGIEVYVNTRSKDTYRLLELEFQPRITKALDKPNPDVSDVLADVQAMLIKFERPSACSQLRLLLTRFMTMLRGCASCERTCGR